MWAQATRGEVRVHSEGEGEGEGEAEGEVHGRRRRVVCVACVVREWRNGRERVVRAARVSMQRECECGVRTG